MNMHRIAAIIVLLTGVLLFEAAIFFPPAQLEARNTSVVTTGPTMKPMNSCEVACGERGGIKGGGTRGAGGSGTAHVGN